MARYMQCCLCNIIVIHHVQSIPSLPSYVGGKRGSIAPSNSWLATMVQHATSVSKVPTPLITNTKNKIITASTVQRTLYQYVVAAGMM